VTAGSDSDLFLAKFDPSGQHIFSKRFGSASADEREGRIAVDAAGNIVLAGILRDSTDFGGGPLWCHAGAVESADAFAAKYDPNGQHLWSRRFGDALGQTVRGVDVSPAGEPFLSGAFSGTLDFGAGPIVSGQEYFGLYVTKLTP
jgi:hypothetical protein